MDPFEYQDNCLYCEGVKLADAARQFQTPTFVYSQTKIEENFRAFDGALADVPHIICYSLKANSNLSIGRVLTGLGAGVDIVSGGELFKALKMGVDSNKIVYASVGKTQAEIEYAIKAHILMFNVESRSELEAIDRIAARVGAKAGIALRVNPDIDAQTHPYITTGMLKYKFGIPADEALELYQMAQEMPNVETRGIQMHIGSQLVSVRPIADAASKLLDLFWKMRAQGIELSYINIGGGLGISYRDEEPQGPEALAAEILPMIKETGCTLIVEPGRFIVGNSGALLTSVLYVKTNPKKKFVVVDAGMNDLVRPSLYDAYHPIVALNPNEETEVVDVVGPICESGDFMAHDREITRVETGDLLAIKCAGAYGYAMSSNYNARARAAEVLIKGNNCRLIRHRETYDDLVRGEE